MVNSNTCIGCQACADVCPYGAIKFLYDNFGEGKIYIEESLCRSCGLCDKICPAIRVNLNKSSDSVYAIVSKKNSKKGSSGGVFFELARKFIDKGFIVIGAGFNEKLKLKHLVATTENELAPLLKSKYLHSDMQGVYREIMSLLNNGQKILFVGTPCQASAIKNMFLPLYRDKLLIVDFLCRGAGTQKVFDACIHEEEIKKGGEITEFRFRSKSKKAEHSFTYFLNKDGKTKKVDGYAFEFPYYYTYLKYTLFQDACYSCSYAKKERVGDLTLGDFWGIQNYDKKLKDFKGVSLVSINTPNGEKAIEEIADKCSIKKFPIDCANKNQALIEPVAYPKEKTELKMILTEKGEVGLVKRLSCKNVKKEKIYAKTPKIIKKLYSKLKGK